MFTTLIAFAAVALAQGPALKCPVMGSAVAATSPIVEYNGAQFAFCCAGCDASFAKTPADFLKKQTTAGSTVGAFLFDPVSRKRLELDKAQSTVDFGGIRYPFESAENRARFESSPKVFATAPAKEALYCPVGKEEIATYSKASDYVDHEGVRWYMCCAGCGRAFEKEPASYLIAGTEKHVHAAMAIKQGGSEHAASDATEVVTKVKFGKYEAVLRVPEEGLFAQEEIDVEFRVVDTTAKDAVEEGFKGVGGIEGTAVMTMPSMAGMPEAKPEVHREGVPGDYGIVLFFPHGGDYKIALELEIPGQGKQSIAFVVDVKDERPADAAKVLPYELKVVDWPAHVMAGKSMDLKLNVVDTKTGKVQTAFDEAHTKFFHLLLASKDLNWFLHEHPEMDRNGKWTVPITFPAGGDYWVYGDVAPTGKGSRVLIAKVSVMGPKPTWDTKLTLAKQATDGGLKGELSSLAPIVVGRNSTLQVKLTDEKTGKAAGDTVPWLGAAGHMMIFIRDGQTVVHSHPAESEENALLVKEGIVRFSARFPKPGTYKVYSQFDWRGEIRTLGYVIEVK